MLTWDEAERQANIRKHGVDFRDCGEVLDGPMVSDEDTREDFGEYRIRSFGLLRGTVVLVVWSPRGGDTIHLISARKADRYERKRFWQHQRYQLGAPEVDDR